MLIVILTSGVLIALSTVIHYEVLRGLNVWLPFFTIPGRTKLLVVIFVAFASHTVHICIYGLALFLLSEYADVGTFRASSELTLVSCLYFSSETYTSLGFGDITPVGPIRLIAGVEALNGLLLIGWSVSYAYLAMERFWNEGRVERQP